MIKHVGRHNNRKVVILFKKVPGEDHMCLLVYSDQMPQLIHDQVMRTLESEVGQQAKDFADALFRQVMADGRNCLETIHKEGYMKKVPTNQVIVTPNAQSSVRLDELNNILDEMDKGEAAVKKMAELDSRRGLADPYRDGNNLDATVVNETVLSDADIAKDRLAQASKMRDEAKILLDEATRLEQEAASLTTPTNTLTETPAKAPRKTAAKAKPTVAKTTTKAVRNGSKKTAKTES